MRKSGVMEPNVARFCIRRESKEDFTRTFQRKLHVTESMIRRLGLEAALEGHTGCINCLEWNEKGSILASVSDDVKVIIWDPFCQKKLTTLHSRHQGNVYTVKFLPNSNDCMMVTGAGDCLIHVHDVLLDRVTLTCSCHLDRVNRIATSPSEPYLFWSAAEDGNILQYDLRTSHICRPNTSNVLINLVNSFGEEAEAKCVAINPVQKELLAVGANDPYIRLYDRRMIKPTDRKEILFPAAKYPAPNTPDGLGPSCVDYFVAGHLPLTLSRWDDNKKYRRIITSYVTFGPNGRDLLVNMGGEQVYIFDIVNKRNAKSFEMSFFQQDEVEVPNDDILLPSNEHIINNSTQEKDCNWRKSFSLSTGYSHNDLKMSTKVEKLILDGNIEYELERYHDAIRFYNQAINLYPNYAVLYVDRAAAYMKRDWEGDMYAALRDCYSALALDPHNMIAHFRMARCLLQLHCPDDALKCLTLFQNKFPSYADKTDCQDLLQDINDVKNYCSGENEASGGADVTTTSHPEKYWKKDAYDYESRYCGHCNARNDINEANFFGSDCQFVVAGSDDGTFFIWDRKTTNIMKILRGDEVVVNCLQPHPTYCLLATGGEDRVVQLWTPRPEDDSRNDREILNLYETTSTNQKRLNPNPFEIMVLNIFQQNQDMGDDDSDSNHDDLEAHPINIRNS